MEQQLEPLFHKNSYGYRPLKSAHQAINQVRKNCIESDWVIDLDIRKFFDEIDHKLMLKGLTHSNVRKMGKTICRTLVDSTHRASQWTPHTKRR